MVNIKEEFKDLVYDMMMQEIRKMDYESDLLVNKQYYGEKNAVAVYEYSTYQADITGYELGLKFKKLKIEKEGQLTLGYLVKYPDVTRIAAKNLISKYGLMYPECWTYDNCKIIYVSEDKIKDNYTNFLVQVDELFNNNKITGFDKKRLYLAGKYFYDCDVLILANANNRNDEFSKSEVKTKTR